MKKQAKPAKGNALTLRQTSPELLIQRAIDKGVSVETMERLLAMRRELKAEYAKQAFDEAMAAFQAECPTIKKTKPVKDKNGRELYRYAPIDSIVEQVKPHLKKSGFSYTVDAKTDGMITAICKVTHELGHSETSEFSVPTSSNAIMNKAQEFASALTFAKRYAFCNAFGILTGDEDNDSRSVSVKKQPMTRDELFKRTLAAVQNEGDPDTLSKLRERIKKTQHLTVEQKEKIIVAIDKKA
jgi:hypothetical protein